MNRTLQRALLRANRAPATLASSAGARWFVLLFAMVFGVVATAQAAHLHRPANAAHQVQAPATGSQSTDTEEHCPLCVAMHPALPVSLHVSAAPVLDCERLEGQTPRAAGKAGWHFARFGRPPPVLG